MSSAKVRHVSSREMLRNAMGAAARADLSPDQRLMVMCIALNADDCGVAFPSLRRLADLAFRRGDRRAIEKAEKLVRGLAAVTVTAFQGKGRPEPHPPLSSLLFYAEPRSAGLPSPKGWKDPMTGHLYQWGEEMPADRWIIAIPSAAKTPLEFRHYAIAHASSGSPFEFTGAGFYEWANWTPPTPQKGESERDEPVREVGR